MAWDKLSLMIIAAVALLLIMGWMTGSFTEVKKAVLDLIPNVSLGAKELKAEKPAVSGEQAAAARKLAETINEMIENGKKDCFANYGGMPELGEEGGVIELSEGTINVRTLGGKQLSVDLTKELGEKAKGFDLCVVAGGKNGKIVAEEFYNKFLENDNQEHTDYFLPVRGITIAFDTSGFNENRINFGKGFNDFEDEGWLFTPDGKQICFFPTKDSSNGEEGLNDDYLKGGENSIPSLVRNSDYLCGKGRKRMTYQLEHQDNTWRENLRWQILETEKGLEIKCLWGTECSYAENEVEGYTWESGSQIKFAEMMASAKSWSDISSYSLPKGEGIAITDESGKEYGLSDLSQPSR